MYLCGLGPPDIKAHLFPFCFITTFKSSQDHDLCAESTHQGRLKRKKHILSFDPKAPHREADPLVTPQ